MTTERIRTGFLKVAGYILPLFQSLPPLGVWTGLMTLPAASYLILIFANLPANLPRALHAFFMPIHIPEKILIIIGLLIFVYSVAYLKIKKKEGLIISGPYHLVRHPQYLGIILMTLGFTSWSVWILNHTFGIGFLSPSQTIDAWFIELFAYILLANIEELYLSREYGKSFKKYQSQVPFLIPFLKFNRKSLEILFSILILTILLFGLLTIVQ